jgi:DNA polymerase III subunit gamma/tau
MGQALYRKYRSKSLDEIVGQEHITTTLSNALKAGRVSHAYLLTGPRGVGKTSIARILAHEINDLPYTDEAHLDIIEIDAASNRRIDEIRDLRDRVSTAPASAKYKVYIIDEVHMLTREAFNALLKTLEEPPAHVVFILATTESHKLPDTIVSRTQRYIFRPYPREQVVEHLRFIAKSEQITIDDDALALIAEHGEGSFRDSISLLDQASNTSDHVIKADIERMLWLAPQQRITELHTAVSQGDSAQTITTLSSLYSEGFEPATIATQLAVPLRAQVLASSPDALRILDLLEQLLDVPAARSPRQLLELVLLRAGLGGATPVATSSATQAVATAPVPAPPTVTSPRPAAQPAAHTVPATSKTAAPPVKAAAPTPSPATTQAPEPSVATGADFTPTKDATELWQKTLNEIKSQYNTLYGIARNAKPQLEGNTLTIGFKFGFHQKRINEVKNRQIFADVASKLYGAPLEIACIVIEPETGVDVSTVSNIFGGAELLES